MSTPSSSTTPSSAPERLQINQGSLEYKTAQNAAWTRMLGTPYHKTHTIFSVDIKYSISFAQKFANGAGTCTLTLQPKDYANVSIDMDLDMGPEGADFFLNLDIVNRPSCIFSRTKVGNDNPHTLADFPLHNLSTMFTAIRLRLPQSQFKPRAKQHELRTKISALTSGDVSRVVGTNENVYITDLMNGQLAEQIAAAATLKTMDGCKIETYMVERKMWISIWSSTLPDKTDDDLEQKPTSLHYEITNSKLFDSEPDVIRKEHPVFGNPECCSWQVTIEALGIGSQAPIVGSIDNVFHSATYPQFIGVDTDVKLEPLFADVGGDRSRAALNEFRKMCDDTAKDLIGYLRQESKQSKLPMRELCLPGLKFSGADNRFTGSNPTVPPQWRQYLNESQCKAIEMGCKKKIGVVWGPAACGKSEVLSRLLCKWHLDNDKEKTAVCAPTNVALNQLLQRATKVWRSCMNNRTAKFVRIFSEAEIERQWRNQQSKVYQDPIHLDSQRVAISKTNPAKWAAFTEGRRQLIEYRAIVDKVVWRAYKDQAQKLTALVLEGAQVVFVTCNSLRGGALLHKKGIKNVNGVYEDKMVAWPATSCIIDEAGCANPLQIISPLTTFRETLLRLVLAGDHQQLAAFVQSDEAKKIWPRSFLKDCIDKQVDYVLLNIQYRAHSQLFAPANEVIYDGKVSSHWETEQPRPFLANLLSQLPLTFDADNKRYQLTSFSNFIDVAHGTHQSKPKGSSCNDVSVLTPYPLTLQIMKLTMSRLRSRPSRGL